MDRRHGNAFYRPRGTHPLSTRGGAASRPSLCAPIGCHALPRYLHGTIRRYRWFVLSAPQRPVARLPPGRLKMNVQTRMQDIVGLTKVAPLSRRGFMTASAATAAGYTLAAGPVRADAIKTD